MNTPDDSTIDLHEAPASATAKVRTPNGFEWLITTRTTTTNELLERVALLDTRFVEEQWEPVSQKNGTPDHKDSGKVLDEKCNKCGGDMIISKKGNPYCKAKCWLG